MYSNIFEYNLKKYDYKTNFLKNEKIKISVNCVNQNHFFLENKIFEKKIGYNLYTSCKTQKSKYMVLMLRGWVHKKDINKIKNLPLDTNILALKNRPVDSLIISKYSNQIKKIKSFFMIQKLKKIISHKTLEERKYFYIKLPNNNKYMYNVIVKNNLQIKPIRHFFYSLQWLFFAITLFILYTRYKKHN